MAAGTYPKEGMMKPKNEKKREKKKNTGQVGQKKHIIVFKTRYFSNHVAYE